MSETNNQIPHNLPIEPDFHTDPYSEHSDNSHDEVTVEKSGSDKAIKYALISGFLVILFVVSLGIVSFLPRIISNVSASASAYLFSAFSTQPKITLTLDKTEVSTGGSFALSWKNNTTTTNGNYSFNYKCTDGITLVEVASGKTIVCGTSFPLGTDNGSIKLAANSKNTGSKTLPMNVSFFEKNSKEPTLTNSISVLVDGTSGPQKNNSSDTSGITVSQTNTNSTNQSENYYYPAGGKSDISISLVKKGMVLSNGGFQETSVINSGSRVMVQFQITNNGTVPSGAWSLSATLPTTIQNEKTFTSQVEPSLKPGDSFTMNLAFDSYDTSVNQVVITILSSTDSNFSNNNLTIPFTAGSGYTNYNYSSNATLNVSITNIGQFNRSNGQFYNYGNNTIYAGSTVGVQFTVTNNGTYATGPWTFNANVPTVSNGNYNYYNSGTYNYTSSTQTSLEPGQSANFTIAFDNPNVGSDTIYINTYGTNSSNANNSASRTFSVSN
ncbi:MAG: hypothetical protein WCV55_01650 [Candidatus Paceibacterota bacterium]